MGIQFHKVQQGNLPVNVIGDHVYFTDTGRMYVSQANGSLKEIQDLTALNKQIEDLSVDRGYLTPKALSGLWTNAQATGKYVGYSLSDAPAIGTMYVDVFNHAPGYVSQIGFNSFYNKAFIKSADGGGWRDWEQLATTETAELTPYLVNGWTKEEKLVACRVGDVVTITGRVNRGTTSDWTNIISGLPSQFRITGQTVFKHTIYRHGLNIPYCALHFYHSGQVQISTWNTSENPSVIDINVSYNV